MGRVVCTVFEDILEVHRRHLKKDHAKLRNTLWYLSFALRSQRRHEEALAHCREFIETHALAVQKLRPKWLDA